MRVGGGGFEELGEGIGGVLSCWGHTQMGWHTYCEFFFFFWLWDDVVAVASSGTILLEGRRRISCGFMAGLI